MAKYWQIAAGDQGRCYGEFFLKYGMAFIGDKTLMDKVSVGDVLALKDGITAIRAVGKVHRNADGDKDWLKDFDGWDLSHYKYVKWRVPLNGKQDVQGLSRGMLQQIRNIELKQQVDEIWCNGEPCEPCEEPKPTNQVTDKELLRFLVQQGFRPGSADELTRTIARVRLLADYYYEKKWEDVREHETRTFLVVPLLLALGWSEQQLKIELPCGGRQRVDVACFRALYNGDLEGCVSVIETKGFSKGLKYAHGQAIAYAKEFPNCRTAVLTNGYCYKVFVRGERDASFPSTPTAYLNLRDLREKYPLDPENVDGACGAIKCLLPN